MFYYVIKAIDDEVSTMEIISAMKAQRIELFSSLFWKVCKGSAGREQTQGKLSGGLTIQSDSTILTLKYKGVT